MSACTCKQNNICCATVDQSASTMPQDSEMETMTACVPKRMTHYPAECLPKRRKSDSPTCSQQPLVENWRSEGREHQ